MANLALSRLMRWPVRTALAALALLALLTLSLLTAQPAMAENERTDGIEIIKGNSLPILNNRFRVDYAVKEMTLLFFRVPGTPPVILVKPDGSKMYASMAVTGEADWFDETTYDLIKISNPMPGPWQAVGQLMKGSKVLIITDFELNVDDLPPVLIQNETIKLTGRVTNGGEPIYAKNIRDVITLVVDFVSTNNQSYRNFGAGVEQVSNFLDDGKGFDERPQDGIFTGEFKLDFASGEWIPKYHIATPLMRRELVNDPVIIEPNPIQLSIKKTTVADEYHQLKIDITGDYVVKEKMIFQGKVFYPNQDIQSFSITEKTDQPRLFNVINYDFGLYRIAMTAYGETIHGREIMLDIPDFSFSIAPPVVQDAPLDEAQITENKALALLNAKAAEEPPPEPVDYTLSIIIMVTGNLVLIVVGYIVVRVVVQGKPLTLPKLPIPKFSFKRKNKGDNDDDDEGGKGKDKKSSGKDEILDLSLPDG